VQFAWTGPKHRRPSAQELRALEEDGIYGAIAALLNDGVLVSTMLTTHAPQPEPAWDRLGALFKAFVPRRAIGADASAAYAAYVHQSKALSGPAAKSLGEILAPLYSGPPLPGAVLPPELATIITPQGLSVPQGTGQALRAEWTRGGWPALQYALIWWSWVHGPLGNEPLERVWGLAMTEVVMFDHAGFDLAECAHGRHWYVRKDVRQTDCLRHKRAGQQARWRAWAIRRRRRRARGTVKTA
jgi:hypothetical protein